MKEEQIKDRLASLEKKVELLELSTSKLEKLSIAVVDYIKDFSEATLDSFEKIAKIFKLDLQIKESENEWC